MPGPGLPVMVMPAPVPPAVSCVVTSSELGPAVRHGLPSRHCIYCDFNLWPLGFFIV